MFVFLDGRPGSWLEVLSLQSFQSESFLTCFFQYKTYWIRYLSAAVIDIWLDAGTQLTPDWVTTCYLGTGLTFYTEE